MPALGRLERAVTALTTPSETCGDVEYNSNKAFGAEVNCSLLRRTVNGQQISRRRIEYFFSPRINLPAKS